MKKCPVCGVEHSDIVPVCSICGSPLTGADLKPETKAPVAEPAAPVEPPVIDFSEADIQAAVSSVVSAPKAEPKVEPKAEEPAAQPAAESAENLLDDIDNPFVVNAMKTPAQEVTAPTRANSPKKAFYSGKITPKASAPVEPQVEEPVQEPAADVLDTTAVAAASALKVQEAMKHAEAARARQASENVEAAAPEQQSGEQKWSERKHKRGQKNTTTPVIAAVCALLALLIVAMLFLLGKMMLDDPTRKPADDQEQPGITDEEQQDQQGEDAADPNVPAEDEVPEGTDIVPEDVLPEADGNEPAEGDDEQTGDQPDAQQPQGNEPVQQPESTQPELPAITEVNDTVYTTDAVNVRDYPSTDEGAILSVLSSGQAVTRTGKVANGWSRVEVGGKVGYISDTYLSASKDGNNASDDDKEDAPASTTTAYITSNGVNLRSEPSGTVLATLMQNQKVELTGKTSGNWSQVKVSGLTGYVYNTYLSNSKVEGGNNAADNDASSGRDDSDVKVTKVNETVYATTGVNVRDYPSSTNSNVINVLTKNQSVKRTGITANGWSRIEVGGVTGYVYSDYLSTSKNSSNKNDNDDDTAVISGYILPKSNSKTYTADELDHLSSSELRLARNEIFARHGRKFNDKGLQDYFNSCSWYKGTIEPATFDAKLESYLNSYELANLDLIRSLE